MRGRYSDPVENINSYVQVHNGVDKQERLLDVEWIRAVVEAAREVDNEFDRTGDAFHQKIDRLKEALK